MIESILARDEGKTLEFKKNCRSLDRIVRTAVAFGLTLEAALEGVSRLRNRLIGRVFRELGFIEQWASGLGRMRAARRDVRLPEPRFEELVANFRVPLLGKRVKVPALLEWQAVMVALLQNTHKQVINREPAKLWKISDSSARARLRRIVDDGILVKVSKEPMDTYRGYVLRENRNG